MKDQFIGMNVKQNVRRETNNTTNEYRYSLESNFVGVNRLFALIYLNRKNELNDLKLKDIIYRKS